jgi:hypothetical protein
VTTAVEALNRSGYRSDWRLVFRPFEGAAALVLR